MGAGKSRVGRALAARLGLPFVDCDALIAAESGRPIREIFASAGEAGFRELERDAVLRVLGEARERPGVVALGGGAVLSGEVRDALACFPHVVWLTAPVGDLWRRVASSAGAARPLATDEAAFRRLFAERAAIYARVARVQIGNDATRGLADVVDEIAALVGAADAAPAGGPP